MPELCAALLTAEPITLRNLPRLHDVSTALKLLGSLGVATDEAILEAVLRLPRFVPGRQNGRVVAVRLRVPVSIDIR